MNATSRPAFRTSAWLYFVIAFAVAWTAWLFPALASHGVLKATLAQLPQLYLLLFFAGGSVNEEFGWAYAIDHLGQDRNLSFNLYNLVDRSPQRDERGLICWTLLMALAAVVVALSARCYRRHSP